MVNPIIFILITILGAGLGLKITTTQNPVYSGLYLVLAFFLGSGIAFLLGLEFMALLFLLVYAGAIAVLVLFVVMMLDVKAIETPWSASQKKALYGLSFVFVTSLLVLTFSKDTQNLIGLVATNWICTLVNAETYSHKEYLFESFALITIADDALEFFGSLYRCLGSWDSFAESLGLADFLHSVAKQGEIESSYEANTNWFVEFDSSCALNDLSYLLYTTYALLLIIAGVVLLIAMIGAISLTLQKNCPESLYRQLGRESRNAVFLIKEKSSDSPKIRI